MNVSKRDNGVKGYEALFVVACLQNTNKRTVCVRADVGSTLALELAGREQYLVWLTHWQAAASNAMDERKSDRGCTSASPPFTISRCEPLSTTEHYAFAVKHAPCPAVLRLLITNISLVKTGVSVRHLI